MQTIKKRISIVICTANQLLSDMLQRFLAVNEGNAIHQVAARPGALELICLAEPDLLLLDTKLIGVNGLEVARHFHQKGVSTLTILHAYSRPAAYLPFLLSGEIIGLLCLRCGLPELNGCIESALNKRSYITPYLHTYNNDDFVPESLPVLAGLSPREQDVLRLLAAGHTNDQIAGKLYISYHTVVNHKRNIITKVGLKGGHELLPFSLSVRHLLH